MSYASFPVSNKTVTKSIDTSTIINDPFNTLGWIALSCLALGVILIALQSILAPNAFIGGYIIIGMMVGGVGALLGLI